MVHKYIRSAVSSVQIYQKLTSNTTEGLLQSEVCWQLLEAKTIQPTKGGFIHDCWP